MPFDKQKKTGDLEAKERRVFNLKEIHKQLEKKLNKMNKRKTLTPLEEIEKKQIQKEKLLAKDQLENLHRQPTSLAPNTSFQKGKNK